MDLQQLQSLRKLVLNACGTSICDLSSCTQITSLAITLFLSLPQHILLPTGSSVQLQHLSFSAWIGFEDRFQELQNLQDASQLSYLDFTGTYPVNFVEGAWPAYMPHLDTVKLAISSALPQQLVDYSSLRHLDISCHSEQACHGRSLPNWMSQLTQPDTLRVDAAAVRGLSEFPVCLLQLRQLSGLDLSRTFFLLTDLPEEILQFSEFANLTSLCMCPVQPNSRAHRRLTRLENLLGPGILHWLLSLSHRCKLPRLWRVPGVIWLCACKAACFISPIMLTTVNEWLLTTVASVIVV